MDRKEGKRLFIYGTCTKDENEELLKIDAITSAPFAKKYDKTAAIYEN